jgi:hypothetical protein
MIKKFDNFNNSIDMESIIKSIPDSDVPSETNIIKEIGDKVIYTDPIDFELYPNPTTESSRLIVDSDDKLPMNIKIIGISMIHVM